MCLKKVLLFLSFLLLLPQLAHATDSVIVFGSSTVPSSTVTNYAVPEGFPNWSTTETDRHMIMPTAGTVKNLYVKTTTDPTPGTYTFAIMKNGVAQTLTCAITTGSTSCNDTTHTFTVAQGDAISLRSIPTASAGTLNDIQVSLLISSTVAGESLISGAATTATNTTTLYFAPQGINAGNATQANRAVVMPSAGNISEMWVDLSVAPGGADTYTFTLVKGGSDQTQTCTVTGAAVTCNDTGHSISVAAGDLISIKRVASATAAATIARWGLKFVPTTDGESVQTAWSSGSGTAASTTFLPPVASGAAWAGAPESNKYEIGQACTVKNLYLNYATAPGAARNRVLSVVVNGTPSAVTCTVSAAGTTCNDTTHTASVTAGQTLSLQDAADASVTASIFRGSFVTFIAPPTPTPTPTATPTIVNPLFVRSGGEGGAVTSTGRTFSSNTAHDLMACGVFLETSTDAVTSVVDTTGNNWVASPLGQSSGMVIYYAKDIAASGSNTVTVTINNAHRVDTLCYEYSGIELTTPVDASAQGSLTTNCTSGTLTTTQTGDLIFGFSQHNGGSWSIGSGFTSRGTYIFNTWNNVEDKQAGAAGNYPASYTNAATCIVQAVAFQPPLPTPTPTPTPTFTFTPTNTPTPTSTPTPTPTSAGFRGSLLSLGVGG